MLSTAAVYAALQPRAHVRMDSSRRRERAVRLGREPGPPSGPATELEPATLAGVVEDHRLEQFYWDEPTRARLLARLGEYRAPLLVGTPSLAVEAENAGLAYTLLDVDERFAFLPGFRRYDLFDDAETPEFDCDAIFCDPPFANFELDQLKAALTSLAGGASLAGKLRWRGEPALFIAYNAKREEALLQTFPSLRKVEQLGYLSVKPKTQANLWLYASHVNT